jgi:hypothetical protein
MVDILVNKLLILLFVLSGLTTLRHGYYFVQAVITSTEEQPKKYKLSKTSLLFLGISIAYIFSAILTGIKL